MILVCSLISLSIHIHRCPRITPCINVFLFLCQSFKLPCYHDTATIIPPAVEDLKGLYATLHSATVTGFSAGSCGHIVRCVHLFKIVFMNPPPPKKIICGLNNCLLKRSPNNLCFWIATRCRPCALVVAGREGISWVITAVHNHT